MSRPPGVGPRLHAPTDLGTIVGVWAHPDDEAYLAGGLMAAAVAAGQRVVCVTATRGEAGFPDDDVRSLAERSAIREAELAACLAVLGVTEHRWLGQPDGACHEVAADAPVAALEAILAEVRPDTVLTFGPDGMTGHRDHVAAGCWTTLAVRGLGARRPRLLYATKTPEWNERFEAVLGGAQVMMDEEMEPPATPAEELALWLRLDDELAARKVRALRSQASQTQALIEHMGELAFHDLSRDEQFREPTPADWAG